MRKALTTEHEKVGIRKPRFFFQRREAFPLRSISMEILRSA